MVMNLYMLLFVSLPEAFLNLAIVLIITGGKDNLRINRQNVIRFVTCLALMLTTSWFIRPIAPSIIINVILHTIAYLIIISIIYRLNVIYTLFGVAFAILVMSTVEVMFLPYVINYIFKGMENFQKAYHWYILLSLPHRIVQLLVIAFFWRYEVLLLTRINRRFHSYFVTSFLLLAFVEHIFYFIFVTYSDKMSLAYQITYSLAMFTMVLVLNAFIFRFMYIAIGGVVVNGYNKYKELEEDAKFAFSEIRSLLIENKVDEAINLIDDLNR